MNRASDALERTALFWTCLDSAGRIAVAVLLLAWPGYIVWHLLVWKALGCKGVSL